MRKVLSLILVIGTAFVFGAQASKPTFYSPAPATRVAIDPNVTYGGYRFTVPLFRDISPTLQTPGDIKKKIGQEIWFNATGGSDRTHTYVFQQRLGIYMDWYKVLGSEYRDHR